MKIIRSPFYGEWAVRDSALENDEIANKYAKTRKSTAKSNRSANRQSIVE